MTQTPFEAAAAEMRADIMAADRAAQNRPHDHVLTLAELYQGAEPGDVLDQAARAAEAALAARNRIPLSQKALVELKDFRREPTLQGLRQIVCLCDSFIQSCTDIITARMAHQDLRDHAAILLMLAGDRVGARMTVRKTFSLLLAGDHSSLCHYELWVTLVEALHVATDGRGEDEPDDYGPVPRLPSRLIARQRLNMQTEVMLLHEHATAAIIDNIADDIPPDPDFDFMDLERPGPLRRRPLRPAPRPAPKAVPAAPAVPAPAGGPARRALVSGSLDHLTSGPLKDYRKTARELLPSISVPDLSEVRERLVAGMPWAAEQVARMLSPLVGRDRVVLPPYLLVGAQGTGKTEAAVAIAEALGLPTTVVPCGGLADGMWAGTSRAWSTTRLDGAAQQILADRCMTVCSIHDELDKCARSDHNGSHHAALLGMLEPSRRHAYHDPALEAACDLSGVSFLATANGTEPLQGPLLDRFTVITWPAPRRQDLPVVARRILQALRREGGLDPAWMPDLDASEIRALQGWQGGSMRPLRRAIERLVALRSDPKLAN
ncbi:hypothetical protein GCM10007886_34050 [Methylobacterium gregans]|uniref:Lon protease n=1 Tax=Methylobacterium gregans TaxID=374424 RepID=A0AA37HPZ6_9HYPH|nr:AAA family ATPase [Methylobacterium gregans]MDQ0522473.1 hypothetical protein [Methylobacterium gregans]GJD79524.1 Lon protease [Methylobacterium gregans]GLS55221.1 hypothetical protein GCM10007886_34050 [Methylobacterium gregans]